MTIFLGLFIAATSILHLYFVSVDISKLPAPSPSVSPAQARPNGAPFLNAIAKAPISLAVAIVAFVLIMGVVSLGFYHASLMTTGVTTSEDIKSRFKGGNPFFRGNFFKQCYFTLCGPTYPSAFDEYHRYDYFEHFEAHNVNLKDYPYVDDGQHAQVPNTYVNPFVPGSYSLRMPENHMRDPDSDDEATMQRQESPRGDETSSLLPAPERVRTPLV